MSERTTNRKLIKKLHCKGIITCLTGLHIGGSSDSTEIGGLDNPVIRRASDGQPYIPGSSLKGKMRSLLQQVYGQWEFYNTNNAEQQPETAGGEPTVADLFGSAGNKDSKSKKDDQQPISTGLQSGEDAGHASCIIFRDAHLREDSVKQLEASAYTEMPYTEIKQENTIDRHTGVTVTGGIRTMERVPANTTFDFEVVINIYEGQSIEKRLRLFHTGLRLLEADYLGGSGSRGYGQISFNIDTMKIDEMDMETFKKETIPTGWSNKIAL